MLHHNHWQEKQGALGKTFIDHGGDLGKISKATGIRFKPGASASDPADFANQYLMFTIQDPDSLTVAQKIEKELRAESVCSHNLRTETTSEYTRTHRSTKWSFFGGHECCGKCAWWCVKGCACTSAYVPTKWEFCTRCEYSVKI